MRTPRSESWTRWFLEPLCERGTLKSEASVVPVLITRIRIDPKLPKQQEPFTNPLRESSHGSRVRRGSRSSSPKNGIVRNGVARERPAGMPRRNGISPARFQDHRGSLGQECTLQDRSPIKPARRRDIPFVPASVAANLRPVARNEAMHLSARLMPAETAAEGTEKGAGSGKRTGARRGPAKNGGERKTPARNGEEANGGLGYLMAR